MEDSGFWVLRSVSDARLRCALSDLLATGSRTEARIIAHLAEVEERRLHLRDGSESLYAYCIHVLHLSNSEAYHRITAARIARRFPIVFRLLEQRALHLTAVCLLRDYLTSENHRELLEAASHKTKVQIEDLIARRFPRPDVESRIRKLPAPRAAVPPTLLCESLALPRDFAGDLPVPATSHSTAKPNAAPEASPSEPPAMAQPARAAVIESTAMKTTGSRPTPGLRNTPQPRLIEPLSEARYRIQLNASAALKEKLDRLRELTSHANPSGDIALIIERALDLALAQAEKQRFAGTDRPRRAQSQRSSRGSATQRARTQRAEARDAATQRAESSRSVAVNRTEVKARKREHIANAVVREVVARDQARCTYVGTDGCRCAARAFLQIHHEESWARGGADTVGNLRVVCAAHNRLLAEQEFGARYVAQRVKARITQRPPVHGRTNDTRID